MGDMSTSTEQAHQGQGMLYEPGKAPGVPDFLVGVGENVGEAGKALVKPAKKALIATTAGAMLAGGVATAKAEAATTVGNLSRAINRDTSSMVEQQELPLHLDAIEVADLNPGGSPLFTRTENVDDPALSTVKPSVDAAVSLTRDYIQLSADSKVKGITDVTAVIAGKRVEATTANPEPTVTPTAPTSEKSVSVLVTAVGFGFLVRDGQVYPYDNTDLLTATNNTEFPADGYVFLMPDGNLTLANYKTGTTYATGQIGSKGTVEWTGATVITAPDASVKGVEYYRSLDQMKLVVIADNAEKMAGVKSLSFTEYSYNQSGGGTLFVDIDTFPVVLEKPHIELVTVTDMYTNEQKDVQMYVVPVLYQAKDGTYFVTNVYLGEPGTYMGFTPESGNVYKGKGEGYHAAALLDDLVKKLEPNKQYLFQYTLVVPDKYQVVKDMLKRYKDEGKIDQNRFDMMANKLSLVFTDENTKNVAIMFGPFRKPDNVVRDGDIEHAIRGPLGILPTEVGGSGFDDIKPKE